jgi:predicted AAA+ superfamily ATPase
MILHYVKRFFHEPKNSYFLFGPRGTGKSTLTSFIHPDALLIDLRLHKEKMRFASNPDLLKAVVEAQSEGKTIIIDEIQKVPELLPIVHILIERKKNWKFILTGSNARKLKRSSQDLLGGRALKRVLYPFMAAEIKEAFELEDALAYGLLPLRFSTENPLETLEAYIGLYLEEEIKMEGFVRQIQPFSRFLQSMSFSHGEILNVTNISRDCHVKRTTVDSWISILEDMFIAFQLEVFADKAKRDLSAQPKFYFFDTGIYQALRPHSIKDVKRVIDGHALEGLVAQHLVAWKEYTTQKHSMHFWRTRSGVEVDFIIFGPLGFWAIEVKHSDTVHPADLNPLNAFVEDYPEAQPILLYRGKDTLLLKNCLCLPVESFLTQLMPNSPIYKR